MVDESIVEDTQRFVVEETSDLSGVSDDAYVRLRDSCRQSYIQCIHQGRNNAVGIVVIILVLSKYPAIHRINQKVQN